MTIFRPTGGHSGNTLESWLYALHMTRVFGRAYQIFVCAGARHRDDAGNRHFYLMEEARGRKLGDWRRRIIRSSGSKLTVMKHLSSESDL